MFDLGGKTAIVTGAGRGIGRAIAEHLAGADARVALVARTGTQLAEVAEGIGAAGGTAIVVPLDLSSPQAPSVAVETVVGLLGGVEVLVNNAAVPWPVGPTATCDADEWAAAFQLNVLAQVRLVLAVLPAMLAKGSGRIINLSSGAARPPGGANQNAYSTAKAAVEMFTLNLGAEIDGSGVTINALRPGATDTPMQTWMREQDPAKVGAGLPARFAEMQRLGIIKDAGLPAARVLALLRSDDNGLVVEMVRRREGDHLVDVESRLWNLG